RRYRRQPQELRHHGRRRRPPAPHPRPEEERLLARRARARRRARRRPRAHRCPARRLDHRRGDRRAGRRLYRRADPALALPRAASPGTPETYADEGLLTRGAKMAAPFEHAVHSLAELPHVIDTRNIGLVGAIELESIAGAPGKRAFDVFRACFERGVLIRT